MAILVAAYFDSSSLAASLPYDDSTNFTFERQIDKTGQIL